MPNSLLPTRKGLQTSAGLFGWRRNIIFGKQWQFLAQPFSITCILPQFGANAMRNAHTVDQRTIFSAIGTLARTLSVPSVTAPHCQSCIYRIDGLSSEPKKMPLLSAFQRSIMSACLHVLSREESASHHLATVDGKSGQLLSIRAGICYSYKSCGYHRSLNRSLHRQELWRTRVALCCSGANGNNWKPGSCIESRNKDFQLSRALPYSTGAAHDLSFDSAPRDHQLESSVVDPNRNSLGDRSLKLLSGSCYLPHPDKEETGGEDAHFICDGEQAIGVADGVGGWADFGVNAGHYARELMFNSVSAIQDEPQGLIDSARVLEKAYSNTKAKGSSTACIVALTDQGIHAVNLGDSGFIVVRDGSTIFRSPVQQHDFNFTYQLESGNGSDLPSSAQVFKIAVESGDVIVAGTDGLFDNLYNNEINAILVHASRVKLAPQVTAQKIAALARQRAQDKNRQTPFSTAAQDAGYLYYGGKLDDVTVVVSYITASCV